MAFVHLHFHTSYSFLDGYNPIPKAVARVKELGMTACAITDHNHVSGVPVFQEECEKQGIKPLLGMEGYFTPDMKEAGLEIEERRECALKRARAANAFTEEEYHKMKAADKKKAVEPFMYDMTQHHILFLAKNLTGWHNLVKIQSIAARDCTYNGRFLCDMNLLRQYHEGVICTTACISSYPSHMLQQKREDLARQYIVDMKEIFGDDFYLEIQPLNIEKQRKVNLYYMSIAKELGIQCIATNDVHYTLKSDWNDHDTLLCIGTGKKKSDMDRMHYSNDFWIRSEEEMKEAFENQTEKITETADKMWNLSASEESSLEAMDAEEAGGYESWGDGCVNDYKSFYLEAMNNTNLIADKIENHIQLGADHPLFPDVKVPAPHTPEGYLTMLAYRGLYKYLGKHPDYNRKEYEERLDYELGIINPKGFAPYMLTVREYVTWANEHMCSTGPGRGSAAGSLCLFCIGVTKNVDPIQNQLLFSRFLTADRQELPDVDVDFSYTRRDSVIHHFEDYYGEPQVAHIGTYGTMGVRSGVKDVCRVLDVPYKESDAISKVLEDIEPKNQPKFKDYDNLKEEKPEDWKRFHEQEEKYPEVFRLARAFEGSPRQFGVHASGVLITPIPVTDVTPVRYIWKDDKNHKLGKTAVTLYTGPQVEEQNFVKVDILGLKTLSIIEKCLENIPGIKDINELYKKADLTDKAVWSYICSKDTDAMFQIESDGMKGVIDIIQPENFDDLTAINALYRPGPLAAGMHKEYAEVKEGKKAPSYPIRGCEDILDRTYGTMPYQEQTMAISKKVAGFNDMQADSLTRKIVAKKKVKLMPMLMRCHIYGKKNCKGPDGWENDMHAPWYDPEAKYGAEIPGAISNGYTEEEMLSYFKTIEGFASYAFNKSHAACYAYLAYLTAWLKFYYPEQYMAAQLTLAATNPDKLAKYIGVCDHMGIRMDTPDINISKNDFTPDADNHRILYGLGAIKGVGGSSVDTIIENAPYENVDDALKRLPKKAFNKRVAERLIKSGAFSFENDNRIALLNELHTLRKDKKKLPDGTKVLDLTDERAYDKGICLKMEEETLGAHITYHTWWEELPVNGVQSFVGEILSVKEHKQKNGKMMAFVKFRDVDEDFEIECCCFACQYHSLVGFLYQREGHWLKVNGKKSDKGSFIINDAEPVKKNEALTA